MAAEILGREVRKCISVSCFPAPGTVCPAGWGETARDARLTQEGSKAQQHEHCVRGAVLPQHAKQPENQSVSTGTHEGTNISRCLPNKHKETLSELMGCFSWLGRQSNTQMEFWLFFLRDSNGNSPALAQTRLQPF